MGSEKEETWRQHQSSLTPLTPIRCQSSSSRDQGHEHRGNQIWGKQKNWEEKFGIRRLSNDYYNVVTLCAGVQKKGG